MPSCPDLTRFPMKKSLIFPLFVLAAFISPGQTMADDSGLAYIHTIKPEKGRRLCMTDHYHDGSGKGGTREEAEKSAKSSWISFTIFEYGDDWGSYDMAVGSNMDCSQSAVGWNCSTSARPCRKDNRGLKTRSAKSE